MSPTKLVAHGREVIEPSGGTSVPVSGGFDDSVANRRFARLSPVLTLPLLDTFALTVLVLSVGPSVRFGAYYVPAVLVLLAAEGQHRLRICLRVGEQVPRVATAATLPLVVLLPWGPAGPIALLGLLATAVIIVLRSTACQVLRVLHRRGRLLQPVVLLGADPRAVEIAELLERHPELGLRPCGFLDRLGGAPAESLLADPSELPEVIVRHGIARVLVCDPAMSEAELTSLLRSCRSSAVDVCLVPRLAELGMAVPHGRLDEVWGIPLVPLRRWGCAGPGACAKRVFDLLMGAVLVTVTAPVTLLLAGAIRLRGGAVFFRQLRVTGTGAMTSVVKLRTVDSGGGGWSVSPQHCTRLGRWLRVTHFDELPQLVHVVRAEMSLVGPRPERPRYAERFAREIPHYADRHRMLGGMTGWAQVHGLHGDTSIAERARFDNQYIEYWSPWLDVVIVMRTLMIVAGAVLRCRAPAVGGGKR
ncbi:lipopolysaccharide/colanic/teichoic acid biosynthesis glycosyltransferase [Saccharopolyspora lacisalsi]|uniref:Lipopolysaccharide/colanic/teichoic acid biosynthesis glycosyltransferase n=1 Tax=Halosaccharopolyspora lacisalsi TaxID=1000566 RepID=A0A839DQX4_9PSEU|nr:sugar transferase [Halosaccharopolyspora lacisalsi]MBA8824382.1 lipopolysaccharide/colanic/teichoic acid biosynthesis glycosyltransferase [Halosaccharopolyspora lacisalsi]